MDQELAWRHPFGRLSSKKSIAPSFQIGSGWNWQDCSSSKYASIDGVWFSI